MLWKIEIKRNLEKYLTDNIYVWDRKMVEEKEVLEQQQ